MHVQTLALADWVVAHESRYFTRATDTNICRNASVRTASGLGLCHSLLVNNHKPLGFHSQWRIAVALDIVLIFKYFDASWTQWQGIPNWRFMEMSEKAIRYPDGLSVSYSLLTRIHARSKSQTLAMAEIRRCWRGESSISTKWPIERTTEPGLTMKSLPRYRCFGR